MSRKSSSIKYRFQVVQLILTFLLTGAVFTNFVLYTKTFTEPDKIKPLSSNQVKELTEKLYESYPEQFGLIKKLPYNTVPAQLEINAGSAILIDAVTGNILYEKNADEKIPPASMTKLVEMFVVFKAIQNGEVSLDDIVPLPESCWTQNMPGDASLMFLNKGQTVTLKELMLGLAIPSGNDASIAVANFVCHDMDSFVNRMNAEVEAIGLKNTHFVESSGYSEENITTARDFVQFSRYYINTFPEALEDYHSQKEIRYPQEKNLTEVKNKSAFKTIVQKNTNRLLGELEGCDGLKTGYIDESGYNISLTAKRDSRRFISVTMNGPGKNSWEGNKYRNADGNTLMEFAFGNFADYIKPAEETNIFTVTVPGSKNKFVNLVPAYSENFTVPFIKGNTPSESAQSVTVKCTVPDYIMEETSAGTSYGELIYSIDNTVLQRIPLTADRSCEKGSWIECLLARLIVHII